MKKYVLLLITLITSYGVFAQWVNDSYENTLIYTSTGEETLPKIAADSEGNTYISYISNGSGNYDVLLSYIDKDGYSIWDEEIVVSDHEQDSWISDYCMDIDHDGNAVVAFSDIRNGFSNVYAYKISPAGEFLWGADGIMISNSSLGIYQPRMAITSNNTAFFTYTIPTETSSTQMGVVALDSDGNKLYGEDGLVFITEDEETDYAEPYAIASADEMIILYSISSGPFWATDRNMYVIKLNESGENVWGEPVTITDQGGINGYTDLHVVSDNEDGFFVGWHEDRDADNVSNTYVQHIDFNGNILLDQNGTAVANGADYHRFNPKIVPIENGEVMVFWRQTNISQGQAGLYGQYMDANGILLWNNSGNAFIPVGTSFGLLYDAKWLPEGQATVFYTKNGDGTDEYIHASTFDTEAQDIWSTEISSNPASVSDIVTASFNQEQFIAAWNDGRENNGIYTQNVKEDGSIGIGTAISYVENLSEVKVYPNPAYENINIFADRETTVTIRNVLGQVLMQRDLSSNETMQYIPQRSGIYMVTLSFENMNITKKIIFGKTGL